MRFNLDDYETVESRIRRFYELHDDGRITTEWENNPRWIDEPVQGAQTWVIKASVYLSAADQEKHLPKATGYAFEKDGTGGANNTSALENAETSAIGRALANMNLSGNKRASREEMAKVNRQSLQSDAKNDELQLRSNARDFIAEAEKILNVTDLRNLYAEAQRANAPQEVLDRLKDYGQTLSAGSEDQGTGGRVSASGKGKRP